MDWEKFADSLRQQSHELEDTARIAFADSPDTKQFLIELSQLARVVWKAIYAGNDVPPK